MGKSTQEEEEGILQPLFPITTANTPHKVTQLRPSFVKPPSCAYLGVQVTQIRGYVNSLFEVPSPIVIDSGSDITLILEKYLKSLMKTPKVRRGQRITLVQVTGKSLITGYVNLDLFFPILGENYDTVKLSVEVYVVKGMTTNLILGNDFSEQYGIRIT
jgi:hypothetical protein